MKLLFFLIVVLRGCAATDAQIIQALEMTEASYGQIGRAGEITPSQLSPATVRDHGTDPLANLRWLKKQLARRGVDLLPFNIALCWNAGLTGATTGKAPISSYHYASRMVANLETITLTGDGRQLYRPSMTARQPVVFILQTQ
jgi:hypothetical protein